MSNMREITAHQVYGAPAPKVFAIEPAEQPGGANVRYEIELGEDHIDAQVEFQHGPVPEVGMNGVTMECLLAIVQDRLRCFQNGPFGCNENEEALIHVGDALAHLQSRTRDRLSRGVKGSYQK